MNQNEIEDYIQQEAERIAQLKYERKLRQILGKFGYTKAVKIVDTLQGSIFRAIQQSSSDPVVIKITSKQLATESVVVLNGRKCRIHENIIQEKNILKYLTNDENCINAITKYVDFLKSNVNFYLIMEDGGHSLFEFNIKVHEYIDVGKIEISEWHKLVKIIFKQMLECIEYIHSKLVCHFDISLENILINDIDVSYKENQDMLVFCYDNVQSKLCDFGLAEYFNDSDEGQNEDSASEEKEPNEGVSLFKSNKFCGKPNYQSPEISIQKRNFDASKNDIWCLGVCLFMLITGNAPFMNTTIMDQSFNCIMNEKGNITKLLKKQNKMNYVNKDLIDLFKQLFQFEKDRIDIDGIKQCNWLKK